MRDILKLMSTENSRVWVTSDTHFGHKNITYGESTWDNKETGCRRFNTTREMSAHIVNQINKYVGQKDVLIHLGDWSFGGIENVWNLRKQIICEHIIYITGNHDGTIRKNHILPNVRRAQPYGEILIDGEPGCYRGDNEYPDYVEAQSLFELVEDYMEIMIDKDMFCCMHYPMEEWNDRHHKTYMLHGHQHGNNTYKKGRLDVGIDNAFKLFGEYRPFSIEEVLKEVKK